MCYTTIHAHYDKHGVLIDTYRKYHSCKCNREFSIDEFIRLFGGGRPITPKQFIEIF